MEYSILVKRYEQLEATSKRLKMIDILVDLFKETPHENLRRVIYFTSGKVYPDYVDIDLGFADKMVIRAIAKAVGKPEMAVDQLSKKLGDLGETAEKLLETSKQKSLAAFLPMPEGVEIEALTVDEVWETLDKIAKTTGPGSTLKKVGLLSQLYLKASPPEAKYLTRIILSQLRLGVKDLTIIEALSRTFGEGKESRPIIEHAYNVRSDIGEVGEILATKGLEAVKRIDIQVGRPIRMMAAQRMASIEEILEKLSGKCALEFKYDGERLQAHKDGNKVTLFSRNLNDVSSMFPDVTNALETALKARKAIIEGEITAWDPEKEGLKPFQILMSRRRKYGIKEAIKTIPVKVFIFDILFLENKSLLTTSYPKRRKILESIIKEDDKIVLASRGIISLPQDFEEFFEKSIEYGCEGVMAKDIREETPYQAGNRGFLWIKHKFDYTSEFADSFDLVVVGGFYGKGRRKGTLGTLLMAAYNPEEERFETICKLGSGFTDEDLRKITKELMAIKVDKKPKDVFSKLKPDIWVPPLKVLEIQGADLSTSPVHSCALDEIKKDSGIAIRFPRFQRYREEKDPEQATTTQEIIATYKKQRLQSK